MDKSTISRWIRQARYRAKNHNIYSKLNIQAVEDIIIYYSNNCTYCLNIAETLDHPFPLRDKAPNVQANVLPICRNCKTKKKTNNIIWMFNNNYLTNDKYISILAEMLTRNGSQELKNYIKKVTGING